MPFLVFPTHLLIPANSEYADLKLVSVVENYHFRQYHNRSSLLALLHYNIKTGNINS